MYFLKEDLQTNWNLQSNKISFNLQSCCRLSVSRFHGWVTCDAKGRSRLYWKSNLVWTHNLSSIDEHQVQKYWLIFNYTLLYSFHGKVINTIHWDTEKWSLKIKIERIGSSIISKVPKINLLLCIYCLIYAKFYTCIDFHQISSTANISAKQLH